MPSSQDNSKTKQLEVQKCKTQASSSHQLESSGSKRPRLTGKFDPFQLDSPIAEDALEKATIEAACDLLQFSGIPEVEIASVNFMKDLAATSAAAGESLFVPSLRFRGSS